MLEEKHEAVARHPKKEGYGNNSKATSDKVSVWLQGTRKKKGMATHNRDMTDQSSSRCKAPEKRRVWQPIVPCDDNCLFQLQGTRKKKGMATFRSRSQIHL